MWTIKHLISLMHGITMKILFMSFIFVCIIFALIFTDLPGLRSGETIPGAPMLLSVRSLTDLEQGNADRQSTISTNIYRSSSDENSYM